MEGVQADGIEKANHFVELRADATGGLLSDWRRHEQQYQTEEAAIKSSAMLMEERQAALAELKSHRSLAVRDRVICLLKGSCFAPCLLVVQ